MRREKFQAILSESPLLGLDYECAKLVYRLSICELAFMTGVLPIAKYTAGSEFNMFDECSFLNDHEYEDFYGFEEE